MLYLTIEDIVSNSIIELEKINGRTDVLMDEAVKYGKEVAKHLTKRGYYTLLKLNPGLTESFDIKYSKYFRKYYVNDTFGYQVADDKTVDDIKYIFRDPLDSEVIQSFTDESVVNESFPSNDKGYSKILGK